MTPDRWRRIGDLFDASLRLAPPEREAWLREACGDDEGLRAEVAHLLEQDERAARDGFLPASEAPDEAPGRTASWSSPGGRRPPRGPVPIDLAGAATSDTTVFSPRAAITAGSPQPISAAESMVRARLRELPMIYILIVAMATFYRIVVLNDDDLVLYYLDVTISRDCSWASSPCSPAGGPSRSSDSGAWSSA